jgi:hypothetical protein
MNIATSMNFKRQELVDINLVCIYLKVCTISDIATAVGGSIHLSAWKVEPFSDRRSNLSFPRQEKPTSSQRGLWRKVLRHILCSQPSTINLRLKQPLGLWCAPSNMVWESYIWDGNLYRQNIIEPSCDYERYVSVHLPEALSTTTLKTIFDAKPSTHSAMVPRLAAVPADVRGNQVYTAEFKSLRHPAIQVQQRLKTGAVNFCLQKNDFSISSLTNVKRKNCSNIFSLTALSTLELMEESENRVAHSRGFSALWW